MLRRHWDLRNIPCEASSVSDHDNFCHDRLRNTHVPHAPKLMRLMSSSRLRVKNHAGASTLCFFREQVNGDSFPFGCLRNGSISRLVLVKPLIDGQMAIIDFQREKAQRCLIETTSR